LTPPRGTSDLRVPEGALLLHIGPPKTGTTTVQGAFHACRAAVLAQGVRYLGRARHSGSGVLAVTGRPSFQRDSGAPPIRRWEELAREARSADEARLLLSSEFFADAEPPAIDRIVADLGRQRLRVVVTLRPLAAILPSQWQQYVQSFMPLAYDAWLEGVFNAPRGEVTPTFWRRHRHDELVQRWAAAVGADRVTVVVIDEADHEHVLRVFEAMLGLEDRTLAAGSDAANRSMTLPEIEAVRAVNLRFRAAGLGNALYHRAMHFGATAYMKWRVLPPDEPRIRTPAWALERAGELQREMNAAIAATGVRVVGDLGALALNRPVAGDGARQATTEVCVPLPIAERLTRGIAVIAGEWRGRGDEHPSLDRFATWQLAGAVAARWGSGALARLRRLARRGSAGEVTPSGSATECVSPDDAARAAMDTLVATGILTPQLRRVRWVWIEPPDVAVAGTGELIRTVIRRGLRGLRGSVGFRGPRGASRRG
jgi:hypothetical protein